MKNNDDILKYLSDLMPEGEKADFEKEMALSEELRSRVEGNKNILNGIKNLADINEDSAYFSNLLPRVRTAIDKKKSTVWVPRWAYILTTTAAVFLVVINIGKFMPDVKQSENKALTETVTVSQTGSEELYKHYSLVTEGEMIESAKSATPSFEVGVGEISNKESLKEIVKTRIAYPVEDYLLALK